MRKALTAAALAVVAAVSLTGCGDTTTDGTFADQVNSQTPEPTKKQNDQEGPSLTVSQENAIESAESYLDTAAFSREGLIGQLKYEGFSKKDATFAVDSLVVDWKAQAAASARSYLETGSFSRSGLVDQLLYEGFTKAQAVYGVNQVGL